MDDKANSIFTKYNSFDLLQIVAGLTLLPDNHGKYVRMEELSLRIVQNYNDKQELVSNEQFRTLLINEYPSHHLEDLPVNMFTDLITFYGGDYLIFPGITENGGFILTNQLAAIFHWPDSGIPKQFICNCQHTATLLLAISNTIAQRLGYTRYQEGESTETTIFFPNDELHNRLKAAVTFSEKDISSISAKYDIAKEAIQGFLIDLNSINPESSHIEESPILYKPILKKGGKYLVVSPATLSLALTDYIWKEAERMGCTKEVNDAYHNYLWNNLKMQLKNLEFHVLETEKEFLESSNSSIKTGLYQFDDDKIAIVQYIFDSGKNFKKSKEKPTETNEQQKEKIIAKLKAKPEYSHFDFFDLIILSPIGRDFFYPIMKTDGARTMAIPIFELDVLSGLKETNAIDLWKFTIAREEQLSDVQMINFSFLDQYKIYQENEDSFYLSDETKYNLLHVEPGYSAELIRKSKLKTDKHSVLRDIGGKIANVQVQKKDDYAPIYVDYMGLISSELEFLVAGFEQAVWVTPESDIKETSRGLRKMYWEVNDAISYWLWQIQDDIRTDLQSLGQSPLTVTFDFNPKEKFETIDRNFTRVTNLSEKFQTTATKRSFNILIPAEINPYLYGAENEGERVLVNHILLGINKLLVLNGQPEISEERITQIIATKAPLGMKKKFFILDTSDNLLLDPSNLEPHRYVQDYDISLALNSIVPRLGDLCPPVGELSTKEEKDDLSFKIVQNALFPLLREKITQYNSTSLLKSLISLNESLIRKREELRIHTPTRIACFVTIEQQQIDLQDSLGDLNRTSIATRCLIEHLAAEPSMGSKIVSTAGIDELVAIMDQIIAWGSLSDQIHYDLLDIKMGILPTGRIGTEKAQLKNVFDPYNDSKTKENVVNAVDTFEQVFPQLNKIDGSDVPKGLDNAFKDDFGISFTRICVFIEGLVHIGFLQNSPFASLPLTDLQAEINKYVDEFEADEFQKGIEYLGLFNRGKVDKLPNGCEFIDIMPWRFNRMLSLLRKPIIIVDGEQNKEKKIVFWGARQLLLSRMYLADQCQSDRLRVKEDSKVKKELGKFAQKRGDNLVKEIISYIDPEGLIIDTDVFISPNGFLKNDEDIGDIDVLIISPESKTFLSIECKSMTPSRNIKEMIEEISKIFGSSESDKGWMSKHVRRHEWIEQNRKQISDKYNIDISDFKIKSFFVTQEEMLTPHLKKQSLPMPVISSYDVKEAGLNFLLEI